MNKNEMMQCMRGTHPYIRMEQGADGRVKVTVKTLGDDHHLTEFSEEIRKLVLDWVYWNFLPAHKLYVQKGSDSLRDVLASRTRIVLTNNQFKEAMLMNGFWPRDPKEVDWVFYVQAGSPAIRMQADGFPGIPVIGRPDLDQHRRKLLW